MCKFKTDENLKIPELYKQIFSIQVTPKWELTHINYSG